MAFGICFDWDRLSNLWSGLCRLGSRRIHACRVARRLHPIRAGSAVTLLSFGGFRSRLRRCVRYHCWLDRIIRVVVSYERGTFYGDRHDFTQVHSQLSARQIAGTKFASDTGPRFTVNVAELGGRLGLCRNLHVSACGVGPYRRWLISLRHNICPWPVARIANKSRPASDVDGCLISRGG